MERSEMRRLISDTYVRLLAKMPEDRITVKLLIQECGFSRQTFYYHFKDILDVAEYTLFEIFDQVSKLCCQQSNARDSIRLFLEAMTEHKLLIKRLLNSPHSKSFQRFMVADMTSAIAGVQESMHTSDFLMSMDKQFLSSFMAYGLLGYVLDQLEQNEEVDIEKLTDQICRLLRGEMITKL